MKQFFHLTRHEIRSLMISPATYVAAFLFMCLMAWIYFSILQDYSTRDFMIPPTEVFFKGFTLTAIFIIPLLTMRSIAEERRLGTLETLMTTPVSPFEVVCSKFAAAYLFYSLMWLATLLFPWLTCLKVAHQDARDALFNFGSLLGGYAFVLLSGTLFTAVGILGSSLTRTQLVAGMLSFSILFILTIGLPQLNGSLMNLPVGINNLIEYLQIYQHMEDFSRGIIDTRPILYFLSNTLLILGLSSLVVESKI
jgi:ABC-2 type transport system permease protein